MGREREHFGLSICYKDQVNGSRSEGWSQSSGRAEGWAGEPRTKGCEEAEARPTRPHATLRKSLLEGSRKTSSSASKNLDQFYTSVFWLRGTEPGSCAHSVQHSTIELHPSLLCPFIG